MYWLYLGGNRMCLFRHKWIVARLSKHDFQVSEVCSWCGKQRFRALLPADEQKRREDLAYEKGRQLRVRLLNETRYEMGKGDRLSRKRASELRKQLFLAQQAVLDEIRAEKRKGDEADRGRLRELRSELRGLFIGRQ